MSHFSEIVLSHANKKGWSPRALARHIGLSESQVSNLLNGHRRPSPDTVDKICAAVGLALPEQTRLHLAAACVHGFKVPVPPSGQIDHLIKFIPSLKLD